MREIDLRKLELDQVQGIRYPIVPGENRVSISQVAFDAEALKAADRWNPAVYCFDVLPPDQREATFIWALERVAEAMDWEGIEKTYPHLFGSKPAEPK